MAEIDLVKSLMVRASELGARLWRNNVGVGWAGHMVKLRRMQTVMVGESDVLIRNARPLHAGLAVGSSDLIGLRSIVVTQEMVGQKLAVFVACECKADTQLTPEQASFLKMVREMGGRGFVSKTKEDMERGLA